MNLHSLTVTPGSKHRRMRVGRGESSGKGKTSGRGNKGQMSRTGHKRKATFEGGQMRMIRRIPKRGFTSPAKIVFAPVNLADLSTFEADAEITVEALQKAGIVRARGAKVKILGDGELKKRLVVKAHAFSGVAREKITAAGGTCEVIK